MSTNTLVRRVAGEVIRQTNAHGLRLTDRAQAELHQFVQYRVAQRRSRAPVISDVEVIHEHVVEIGTVLTGQIAEGEPVGRELIRPARLRRALEVIDPTWVEMIDVERFTITSPVLRSGLADQTPPEWRRMASRGVRGTVLLLIKEPASDNLSKTFTRDVTYEQGAASATNAPHAVVFKWIPQAVASVTTLRHQPCNVPCIRSCVQPGCVCYDGTCR